jgi:hypothetical protein
VVAGKENATITKDNTAQFQKRRIRPPNMTNGIQQNIQKKKIHQTQTRYTRTPKKSPPMMAHNHRLIDTRTNRNKADKATYCTIHYEPKTSTKAIPNIKWYTNYAT